MEAHLIRQRVPLPTRVDDLPLLAAAYAAVVDAVFEALAVAVGPRAEAVDLGTAARAAIDAHVRLLIAWNAAINLTAISEPDAIARLHVADSLAALPLLLGGRHGAIVDLGSGGGFPGLPLAAVLPGTAVVLVDSVGKKTAFLEAAVRASGLADRVTVANRRAETLPRDGWDVVTARAVGSLPDLVELALPLLRPGGRLVAWKRGEIDEELAAAARAAAALGGSRPVFRPVPAALASAAGLAGHGFVVVDKVRATPAGIPRDPATRNRRPW